MMESLNRQNHPRPLRPVRILQFGEGNFLRAFADDFISQLNEKTDFNGGVCVVQPRPITPSAYPAGRPQSTVCMIWTASRPATRTPR